MIRLMLLAFICGAIGGLVYDVIHQALTSCDRRAIDLRDWKQSQIRAAWNSWEITD